MVKDSQLVMGRWNSVLIRKGKDINPKQCGGIAISSMFQISWKIAVQMFSNHRSCQCYQDDSNISSLGTRKAFNMTRTGSHGESSKTTRLLQIQMSIYRDTRKKVLGSVLIYNTHHHDKAHNWYSFLGVHPQLYIILSAKINGGMSSKSKP